MNNQEAYIKELVKRDEGMPMVDKLYKKACGHCGNDLHLPYSFCSFCGYRVKEASNEKTK